MTEAQTDTGSSTAPALRTPAPTASSPTSPRSAPGLRGDRGSPVVRVCDYGAGNVRSVVVAFRRLGVDVAVTRNPREVRAAGLTVLPGVGSARSAMAGLRSAGLDEALRERVAAGEPTLGICLGLQLALEETDEDGGVAGLGLLPGRARRLSAGRVPRIGWAPVAALDPALAPGPPVGAFYFAHSYVADTPAATATSEGIVAEARLGSFVGVQFHPEKSGAAGARYLQLLVR